MQVQPNFNINIHQQQHQPNNQQQTQFSIIQYKGNSYRVNTQQYMLATICIHLYWAFWFSTSLIYVSLIIQNFVKTNAIVALSSGLCGALIITSVVIKFKKNLPLLVILTCINLDIYLIVCFLLLILEIKSMLYPTIPFSIIELIILAITLQKKIKILISLPIIAQIYLIILQVDGRIQIKQATVFFIFITLVCCSLVIVIVGFLYLLIRIIIQQRMSEIKKYGLIIIFLAFTSISVGLGILPQRFMFELQVWIGSIIALTVTLLTVIFSLCNIQKAKLFLCDLELVKGDSLKIKKKQISKLQYSFYKFLKVSDSWYKKITQDQIKQISINQTIMESQSLAECLICLQNSPSAIWMPCGHLTTCEVCCEHMVKKNNISCVLCKKVPKQIYILQRQEKQKEQSLSKDAQTTLQQIIQNKQKIRQQQIIEQIILKQKKIFSIKYAFKIQFI